MTEFLRQFIPILRHLSTTTIESREIKSKHNDIKMNVHRSSNSNGSKKRTEVVIEPLSDEIIDELLDAIDLLNSSEITEIYDSVTRVDSDIEEDEASEDWNASSDDEEIIEYDIKVINGVGATYSTDEEEFGERNEIEHVVDDASETSEQSPFSDNDSDLLVTKENQKLDYDIPKFPFKLYSPDLSVTLASLVLRIKIVLLIFSNISSFDMFFVAYYLVMRLIVLPDGTSYPNDNVSSVLHDYTQSSSSCYQEKDAQRVRTTIDFNDLYDYDFTFLVRNVLQLIVISACCIADKYVGVDSNEDYEYIDWNWKKLGFSELEYVQWEARILDYLEFRIPLPCKIPEITFYDKHRPTIATNICHENLNTLDMYTSLIDPPQYHAGFLLDDQQRINDSTFQWYRTFLLDPTIIRAHKYMHLTRYTYTLPTYNWCFKNRTVNQKRNQEAGMIARGETLPPSPKPVEKSPLKAFYCRRGWETKKLSICEFTPTNNSNNEPPAGYITRKQLETARGLILPYSFCD